MKDLLVYIVIFLVIVGFVVAMGFGMACFIGFIVTLVASGFGYTLPYWPTVGAVFLIQLLFGGGLKFSCK